MDLEMVFNELSLQTKAQDEYVARQWMSTFIQTIVLATGKFGVKRVLRFEIELFNTSLIDTGNYSINLWLIDRHVNRDEKTFFRSLQTKYPTLVDFEETEIGDRYILSDFSYEGQPAHGLGVAYLLDALALSLNSHLQWNRSQIPLQTPEVVIIPHGSQPRHIGENTVWIKQRLEKEDPWLRNGLPKYGKYPYIPPKIYYREKLNDFPTKIYGGNKVFIDDKDRLWLWDTQESHWDVQFKPYGRDNYFRVTSDGRLLDSDGED